MCRVPAHRGGGGSRHRLRVVRGLPLAGPFLVATQALPVVDVGGQRRRLRRCLGHRGRGGSQGPERGCSSQEQPQSRHQPVHRAAWRRFRRLDRLGGCGALVLGQGIGAGSSGRVPDHPATTAAGAVPALLRLHHCLHDAVEVEAAGLLARRKFLEALPRHRPWFIGAPHPAVPRRRQLRGPSTARRVDRTATAGTPAGRHSRRCSAAAA